MCPHGYHHNSFVATHALEHIISLKAFIKIHIKEDQQYGNLMTLPYAIAFMECLLGETIKSSDLKPLVWWRYIDILMMWEHGKEGLQKFLNAYNCYHPTINFTVEYSKAKITFQNVTVMKKCNQHVIQFYIKPTGINQYHHTSVCHVYHGKKSIP